MVLSYELLAPLILSHHPSHSGTGGGQFLITTDQVAKLPGCEFHSLAMSDLVHEWCNLS